MQIELDKIRIDGGTQPRQRVYDETVTEYAEALLDGAKFPAIEVFFDGKHYWLADGFHRYHAHRRTKHKTIESNVHNGTKRDAFLFSRGANATHGRPRTNEEKRAAVMSLLDDVEYADASDRVIADLCKVSHMTVGRIRKSIEIAKKPEIPPPSKKIQAIKPGKPVEQVPQEPEHDPVAEMAVELQAIAEENEKLKDQLAVGQLPVSQDAKAEVEGTIKELRARIKQLELELAAVTKSRNEYQNQAAEAIKQVQYWKRKANQVAA